MQTIQLLGGDRASAWRCARARAPAPRRPARLRDSSPTLEPFDCADGEIGPTPETVRVDGLLYVSRPLRVVERAGGVVIERERRILGAEPATGGMRAPRARRPCDRACEAPSAT